MDKSVTKSLQLLVKILDNTTTIYVPTCSLGVSDFIQKITPSQCKLDWRQISIIELDYYQPQVGKSACIVLAKERHSKWERVSFSAWNQTETRSRKHTLPHVSNFSCKKLSYCRGIINYYPGTLFITFRSRFEIVLISFTATINKQFTSSSFGIKKVTGHSCFTWSNNFW